MRVVCVVILGMPGCAPPHSRGTDSDVKRAPARVYQVEPGILLEGENVLDATVRVVPYPAQAPLPPPVCEEIRRLQRLDAEYVAKLLVGIDDPKRHPAERSRMVLALSCLGADAKPAIPSLVDIAFEQSPTSAPSTQRQGQAQGVPNEPLAGAGQTLIALGPLAVPEVTRVLKQSAPRAKSEAAFVLGQIGPAARPAIPTLLNEVAGTDDVAKLVELLEVVGKIDKAALRSSEVKSKVPLLLTALNDIDKTNDFTYPLVAVTLLPSVGVPAREAVPRIVLAFASLLKRPASIGMVGLAFTQTIGDYGREAAPILVKLSADADPTVREAAIGLFAAKDVVARAEIELIAKALRDPTPRVRAIAAATLGAIGSRARFAIPALRTATNDPNRDVRLAAETAMLRLSKGVIKGDANH